MKEQGSAAGNMGNYSYSAAKYSHNVIAFEPDRNWLE
jgi:hypothetical protein